MHLKFIASAVLIAGSLGGCGYKPLDAPCSMNEGGAPTAVERLAPQPAAPPNAVQALSYAEPQPKLAPAPFRSDVASDCGPLRPINAGRLR